MLHWLMTNDYAVGTIVIGLCLFGLYCGMKGINITEEIDRKEKINNQSKKDW